MTNTQQTNDTTTQATKPLIKGDLIVMAIRQIVRELLEEEMKDIKALVGVTKDEVESMIKEGFARHVVDEGHMTPDGVSSEIEKQCVHAIRQHERDTNHPSQDDIDDAIRSHERDYDHDEFVDKDDIKDEIRDVVADELKDKIDEAITDHEREYDHDELVDNDDLEREIEKAIEEHERDEHKDSAIESEVNAQLQQVFRDLAAKMSERA